MSSSTSMLTATQKYAAGALFAMALNQAQIHQTLPLGFPSAADDGDPSEERLSSSSSDSVSEDPQLWVHESSGLLRPIFKFLGIDSRAWGGLEETAAMSPAKHHVGAFLRILVEESVDMSPEAADKETALINGVDTLSSSMEKSPAEYDSRKEKQREYEHACREKFPTPDTIPESKSVEENITDTSPRENTVNTSIVEQDHRKSLSQSDGKPMEEATMLSYPRKVTVLYELLSACLADIPEDNKKSTKRRKGYDARHRVALRLLATWFDIKWIKMEAIETMVACSAMALLKEEESKEEDRSPKSPWAKWKRGGIIGAAAVTGGTLMAITGAAGAGLTGSKVARRIGDVDEFEFKAIGENHNQGRLAVGISISGFVFEEEDFIRPWEGQHDNLERYAVQWESKNLIAVSTAIQDWLTSTGLVERVVLLGAPIAIENMNWEATQKVVEHYVVAGRYVNAYSTNDWMLGIVFRANLLTKGLAGIQPVEVPGIENVNVFATLINAS
ncbi:hypothetical protein DH2020_047857 [Rehmannia glutinosa]|uniref:Uncharacterized protein n=1 Tax=Rehmannia glutinosa TaxID=99300 RepID=A0ABR0U8F8_REHGL